MLQKIRVLHIDDNLHDRQLVIDALQKENGEFEVQEADSREELERYLAVQEFDIVLSDFNILGFDGLQVLQIVKGLKPHLPVIIVTGTGSEEIAIEALKMGAADYVIKSVKHIQGLAPTIKSALENKKNNDERLAALVALRESEELYRAIYDNSSVAIMLTAPDGRIYAANTFACNLFGMTEEEICKAGRPKLVDLSNPNLPILLEERNRTGKAKGELTFIKKDGTRFQAEVSSVVFEDKECKQKTCMVIRDLTEQRKAEKQLRTLGKAVEQSPASIVITDADGKIEFVNAKFTSFMQYDADEIKGSKPGILESDHNPPERFEEIWETIRSGNIWQGEFSNSKKDGTVFLENVVISPLVDEAGRIRNYILVSEDITEKKRMLDDLVVAKYKAEESDRLKTAFLQNISHEIRTPMNAIVGFSGFLNNPDLLPEKREYYTEIIIQSSNQLLSIINDIVNIATIVAGQERLVESNVDLNLTLKFLYDQFELIAQKRNIALQFKAGLSDNETFIKTDRTKLIEIISNLLGNALKFTKQGHVSFGYKLKKSELEFYVEDTGIGISKEMHELIFIRFRQVETSTDRHFGGSGLGLSISKAYVELLGGKIWLTSEPGKGSVFYFTIPYQKSSPADLPTKQSANYLEIKLKSPKVILVAEDEDSNFRLLEEYLSNIGIILRARNGIEALEICRLNPQIALVFMDIKMPEMDGFEATRHIRKLRPTLPIIAQTAYIDSNDRNAALESGCSDFISKPINGRLLISKIRDLLSE